MCYFSKIFASSHINKYFFIAYHSWTHFSMGNHQYFAGQKNLTHKRRNKTGMGSFSIFAEFTNWLWCARSMAYETHSMDIALWVYVVILRTVCGINMVGTMHDHTQHVQQQPFFRKMASTFFNGLLFHLIYHQ